MSADVLAQVPYGHCTPTQCVKGDPQHTKPIPYPALRDATHGVLTVQDLTDSTTSGLMHVNIRSGFNGTSVPFQLNITDTVGKLKQQFLQTTKPDFKGNLDLVYNGKPVEAHQTLAELELKQGAAFLILHRCHGG